MSKVKIKESALSIPVIFQKTDEIICGDDRFTKVKIYLMHLGENVNGSVFEKDVVDQSLSTLQYVPIVGFIEENHIGKKDFSDHRFIIVKDEKGVRRKYLGSAYGVILSTNDNNAHYEERECDDGITRTFLVVDGIIWNFLEDSADIMQQDLIKGHSMELHDSLNSFEGYEDENGLFHFTKFSFRAACILGDKYAPAMINSTIEVQFTMNDFIENLQSELNNKFTTFIKLMREKLNQGGNVAMSNTNFSQTVMEQFNDIYTIVEQYEVMKNRWDEAVPRYYLSDIQDNEVIVVDRKNNYNYYGFTFTVNGDKPKIDFSNGNRKKIRYENYEDGVATPEGIFDFGKHIESIEEYAFNKVNEANVKAESAEEAKSVAETNYTQMKTDYDEIKSKYDEYVQADEERQANELNTKKDAMFAEYEDVLAENTDFAALKERKDELSVDEIEKECAVLFVKVNRANKNFNGQRSLYGAVGITDAEGDTGTEGFITTRYGKIPVKK